MMILSMFTLSQYLNYAFVNLPTVAFTLSPDPEYYADPVAESSGHLSKLIGLLGTNSVDDYVDISDVPMELQRGVVTWLSYCISTKNPYRHGRTVSFHVLP